MLSDLHDYTPDTIYDVCLFVESFCHLKSPQKVLSNISNSTNKIILREYHMKSNEHPKKYVDNWLMNIYHLDEICSFFSKLDFKLTYEEEHYNYSLEPTVEYWLQNLDKLDNIEKTKHIQLLELSARYLKQNKDQILRDIGLATLVFER